MTTVERPFGVTVLAVLHILLGFLILLGGLALMAVSFILPEVLRVRYFAIRSGALGIGLLVLALLDFILAYGLWSGKRWAWIASMILAVLGIAFSVFSLFVTARLGEAISLVLDLLIVYYLMQPRVQGYFGRGNISPSPPPAPSYGSASPSSTRSFPGTSADTCPSCGAPETTGGAYCSHCGAKLS